MCFWNRYDNTSINFSTFKSKSIEIKDFDFILLVEKISKDHRYWFPPMTYVKILKYYGDRCLVKTTNNVEIVVNVFEIGLHCYYFEAQKDLKYDLSKDGHRVIFFKTFMDNLND